MMRWIVGRFPFRYVVVAAGVALAPSASLAAQHARGRVPGVRAAPRRSADVEPGLSETKNHDCMHDSSSRSGLRPSRRRCRHGRRRRRSSSRVVYEPRDEDRRHVEDDDLKQLDDRVLEDQRLLQAPGAANVIWGERLQQLQAYVDLEAAREARRSPSQVSGEHRGSLDSTAPVLGGPSSAPGFIDTLNQRFPIRNVKPIQTPADREDRDRASRHKTPSPTRDAQGGHQPLVATRSSTTALGRC